MKKLVYFITMLSLIAGFYACSDTLEQTALVRDNGDQNSLSRNTIVKFALSNSKTSRSNRSATRAVGDKVVTTPALAREKAVEEERLFAIVFRKNTGEWYETFRCDEVDYDSAYEFDMLQIDEFEMYLVANPDDSMEVRLRDSIKVVADLGKLIQHTRPGEDYNATYFLMTTPTPIDVDTRPHPSDTTWITTPIKLERAVARFDIYNRVPLLKLTSAQMKNRYIESYVATQPSMGNLQKEDKTYNFTTSTPSYPTTQTKGNDMIGTIYSFEDITTGNVEFVLNGTYNGQTVKPHTLKFPDDLPIKRNYLYSIIISPRDTINGDTVSLGDDPFGQLKYQVLVNDWEEGSATQLDSADVLDAAMPHFAIVNAQVDVANVTSSTPPAIYTSTPRNGTVYTNNPASSKSTIVNYPNWDPKYVYVHATQARDVKVRVRQSAIGTRLVYKYGQLPAGYTIHNDTIYDVGGYSFQEYTIHVPQNDGKLQKLPFVLQNGINSTSMCEFTMEVRGANSRPRLPLEFFAEYNIADGDTAFVDNYACNTSKYYNWNDASGKFSRYVRMDGADYYLPARNDMEIVFPESSGRVLFTNTTINTGDVSDGTISRGWSSSQSTCSPYAWYKKISSTSKVVYAYRYRNVDSNKLLSAYRYEYMYNPQNYDQYMLKVTARWLGPNYATSYYSADWSRLINEIATEDFWNANNDDDIVRVFPFCGYHSNTTTYNSDATANLSNRGTGAYYWDTSGYSGYAKEDNVYSYWGNQYSFPVRLIRVQ